MILTEQEIKRIGEGNTGSWQDDLQFARAIESAVLVKLNPRVAELEAVLRECREVLMHYQYGGSSYKEPADKAIAKIDEVLR